MEGAKWTAFSNRPYHRFIVILSFIMLVVACRQQSSPLSETSISTQTPSPASATIELESDETPSQALNPEQTPSTDLANPIAEETAATEAEESLQAAAELENPPAATDGFEPAPLNLIDHGYHQSNREVVYAFIVENPNPEVALIDSEYQVTAFDGTGVSLATDSEFIATLLPNQRLGIAGVLFLPQETPVELLTVGFNTGTPSVTDETSFPRLTTSAVRFRPRRLYSQVTGLVNNRSDQDLFNLRLSAIAYNTQNEIVGAGHTILNRLPANQRAGVDITIDTFGVVDRVELYPRLPVTSRASTGGNFQVSANRPRLLDSGFSQRDIEVFYGFLIENPNLPYAIEDATYHITAFDEAGFVAAVEEGSVGLLLPEQQSAITGTLLVEPDTQVSEIEIILTPGSYELAQSLDMVTADRVTVQEEEDQEAITVSGEIRNPFDFALESIQIAAVLFDEDGQIIGGGRGTVESLPARGRLQVDIPALTAQVPDSAALFFNLGDLGRLLEPNSGA